MAKLKKKCDERLERWFEEAMERIKKATGARTQVQLAEVLEVRQSSISDAKRRCSVPADWFLKLYRSHGLNPNWLSDGHEPVYLNPDRAGVPAENLLREVPASYGRSNARGRGGFFPQTGRMAGSAETPRRASGGGKNLMPCNPLSLCAGIVRIREKGTENLRVPARRFGRPVVKCSPRSLGGNLSGHRPTPSLLQGANRPRRPAEGACSGCPPRHIAGRFSDAKGKNVSDSV